MDEGQVQPGPSWLLATVDDLNGLDFEAPIAGSVSAEADALSPMYYAAVRQPPDDADPSGLAADRAFALIAAVTGMYLKPEDRGEPFGPLLRDTTNRRSASPADFRGPHLAAVAAVARRARHPALRARAADLAWLMDRKQADLARIAIAAYVELVQKVDSGELRFRFRHEDGALHRNACGFLWRALLIGRAIKADSPEIQAARGLAVQLRKRAVSAGAAGPLLWFGKLDLALGVSPADDVAADAEQALKAIADKDSWLLTDLWRLAAGAYGIAKNENEEHRCHSEAAEILASEAEAAEERGEAAILTSHTMTEAIAELHGIPGKKERRKELRHRLVEIQAAIPEELVPFSPEIHLDEIAKHAETAVGSGTLLHKLFVFATLAASPAPREVESSAQAQSSSFLSLFDASHHDHEGKVIFRTEGGSAEASRAEMFQAETLRRHVEAFGSIEPARAEILAQHFVSEDDLRFLLRHSPFVPADHLQTYCRGFLRFFQGDFVSATYTLIPQLENSLRHVLKSAGHEVSKLDDATQLQQDRTISSLFEQMRTELDSVFGRAITTEIDNLFLSKPGPHLRHAVAHGFLQDAGPYGGDAIYGCWFLFRLCMFPLFAHYAQIVGSPDQPPPSA